MKKFLLALLFLSATTVVNEIAAADTNSIVLYSTGFEVSEQFDPQYTLIGQGGWIGSGDGGNGLVQNYFEGMGQQAYMGFSPPSGTNASLFAWYPNASVKTQYNRIQFSVDLSIEDSTNQFHDEFRWSVYNTNGDKLFALDFDNDALLITYTLDDDNGYISTGTKFTNSILYHVAIDMDFKLNLWSAYVDNKTILNNLPIKKTNKSLNFGDVDAVWVLTRPGSAGNNYMVFDNYQILAVNTPLPTLNPPQFQSVQRLSANQVLLRLTGETNQMCHVDYSNDLKQWKSLKNATFSSTGSLDMVDDSAAASGVRFYRANYVP